MHRVRQLVLAGLAPPDCFEPATAEIAAELSVALALTEYYSVADWRAFMLIQRDMATRLPPWGEHAGMVHHLRAFTTAKGFPK